MSNLLVPVYRGEVEFIRFSHDDENFVKWGCDKHGIPYDESKKYLYASDFSDPTRADFCYFEYHQYLINKKLNNGYAIVGMDGGAWLMTKKENIIP